MGYQRTCTEADLRHAAEVVDRVLTLNPTHLTRAELGAIELVLNVAMHSTTVIPDPDVSPGVPTPESAPDQAITGSA